MLKICVFRNFAYLCTRNERETSLQNDGAIAQLVEQRTENPCVPGSIPGGTTKKRGLNLSSFVLRCISTKYSVFLFLLYTHLGCFGAVESAQIRNTFQFFKSVPELASN